MQTRLTTRSLFSSQQKSDEESEHEPQSSALSAISSNMEKKNARAAIRFGDLSSVEQRIVSVDLESPAPIIDSIFFHNEV